MGGALALTLRAGQADHLHCLNAAAEAQGLQRGMALADARAICPGLITRPADPGAEAAALAALCRWAGRYAPLVAVDGADGLVADISGVAHLFGGEAGLRADLAARLERMGLQADSAIAGTRGAAHALARHGGGIIPDGALAEGLGALPVAALRIDHATAQGLARMGLTRIADLAAQPRAPLARRFGTGLMLRLDQALGLQAEPVAARPAPRPFTARLTLAEPIGLQADVTAGLAGLLDRVCARLAARQMGARRLRLELRRVDRNRAVVEVGLARPMREAARILPLFSRGVAAVDAGFGIDALRLTVPLAEPLPPEQLGAEAPAGNDALADLVSRLGNRLGFERILRLQVTDSLIPERSFHLLPAAHAVPVPMAHGGPPRPAFLFPPEPAGAVHGHPPARFRWRRMALTTLRAQGPERIAPEWWLDDPAWRTGLRDYWRIETHQGPRLWLFHTPQAADLVPGGVAGWHVQGEFA